MCTRVGVYETETGSAKTTLTLRTCIKPSNSEYEKNTVTCVPKSKVFKSTSVTLESALFIKVMSPVC